MKIKYTAIASSLWFTIISAYTSNINAEQHALITHHLSNLESIIDNSFQDTCTRCISGLRLGHDLAVSGHAQLVPELLHAYCRKHGSDSVTHRALCEHKFGRRTVESGNGMADDITNVLGLMDFNTNDALDARYACHYMVANACPLPATPHYDLENWWSPKPKDAREPEPSGETVRVLHISDFHVDLDYVVGSEANCTQTQCCNQRSKNPDMAYNQVLEPAREFGEYYCDAPVSLLESTMDNIKMVDEELDDEGFEFAIFTGDMIDHEEARFQTFENAVESEKVSYEAMKNSLPDIPFYITLGNHDSYPFGQIAQEKSGFENRFSWNTEMAESLWSKYNWLKNDSQSISSSHYAAFAVTPPGFQNRLKVISLNANFWYIYNYYNFWNTSDPDPSGMFRFLSDELLASEKLGQRVWVIAHIPVGGSLSNSLPGPSQVLYQILERFSPHVIAGTFFGHTHRDEFQVLYANNGTGEPLMTAFLDESVTPYKDKNPGWRYYDIDASTFSVVDIHHYYTDLAAQSASVNTTGLAWQYGYSARATYDPENEWPVSAPLNATFWDRVVHEKILVKPEFHQTYETLAERQANRLPLCTSESCLRSMYCYFTAFSVAQTVECLASPAPISLQHITIRWPALNALTLYGFAMFGLWTVRMGGIIVGLIMVYLLIIRRRMITGTSRFSKSSYETI